MKIRRFILPAFVAAALHAVLLFAIHPTEVDAIIRPPDHGYVQLPPMPRFPIEPPVEPSPANEPSRPVKPVNAGGGAPRPTLDETASLEDSGFTFEPAPRTPKPNWKGDSLSHLPPGPGIGPGDWTGGSPNILDVGALDRPPRTRSQAAPDYPAALRRDLIEGEVVVEFDVDTQGRVVSARIVSGGHRDFEQAALRAVLRWRFEPGRSGGRVVPFRMAVPISFRLSGD